MRATGEFDRDFESARSRTPTQQFARPWERASYQRIWLRVATYDWRTLTVVPAEDGMPTYDVANLIMMLGASHGESIGVLDFRDVRTNRALDAIRTAESQLDPGDRLVFAARSIRENLATIPLTRATDSAILCVSIGSTSMQFAAETIEQIGKEHFIGSILVRASSDAAKPRPVTPAQRRLEAGC
jgi:hypothetical protein